MRRVWLLTFVALMTGACATRTPAPLMSVERQVLVVLNDPHQGGPMPAGSKRGYRGDIQWPVSLHARARARRVGIEHGLREIHAWPIPRLGLFCVVFVMPDGQDRQMLLERLGHDPRVEHAQPVHEFRGMLTRTYDDPLFDVQYGQHARLLESVHAVTTGRGVRVAIIDGHVDAEHPDLKGQIVGQHPPLTVPDVSGLKHGTAVAGVIAAAAGNGEGVVGLAPDADVSVYAGCRQVEDVATRCTTVSLAEAIEQANEDNAEIINLSIAGPEDWLLERLLRQAHGRGAVLVAAHNPEDPARRFPGSLAYVHAPGTTRPAWFARQEQFSTRAGGGYQVFFGSSMSAAGVAGVAALLRAHWSGPETDAILEDLLGVGCAATGEGTLRIICRP